MARVISLFPTPIYVLTPAGAASRSVELAEIIRRRRTMTDGVSKSNLGGWQSDNDMLAWGGTAANWLGQVVTSLCEQITTLRGAASTAVRWVPEMWANINVRGNANQSHWHPGSYLSFVYYVDDGYAGSADRALGGELSFVDPRMPFLRMRTPDLRPRLPGREIEEHENWIRPFSGLLIGFPSFLSHAVRPYDGDGERISIAINMVARLAS